MEQMRLEIVETTRNVKVFSLFVSVVYLCTTVKSTEPRWSGRGSPDLLQWFAVRIQLMAKWASSWLRSGAARSFVVVFVWNLWTERSAPLSNLILSLL